MDIHSNLEFLCRVCAANTKGKNSVAECVYILKTAGLNDKLDKFLYLKIFEHDSLPKVLCKSCFRQVEATASLSKIARHTQQVFHDFLLSNLPKGPSLSTNTSEFTSSDFMGNRNISNEKNKSEEISVPSVPATTVVQLQPPAVPAALLPPPITQPLLTSSHKNDVIVNVSVSDPLTRDNQQKMISNSQRRQSLLLEPRFTPKSIAQKPATATGALRPIAPKPHQLLDNVNTTNNLKTIATPSLNFYPAKTQQQTNQPQLPQTTQITTFSSGGYVIGRINTAASDKEEDKNVTLPLPATADNILQQKRKNLVKALNNIKANNSGQVSLLKSSQQKQNAALKTILKTPLIEVAEDELPEKIIIAAPKNKNSTEKSKKEPLNLSSKLPAALVQLPATSTTATITAIEQQQPEQVNLFTATSLQKNPAFPENILLGRVIRDMDLIKLILKALKWPVNKQNMELQLQRLKNSRFTDIMSDTNLLQDRDLTQLLGPYLAPVLMAAQAFQQQQLQILKSANALLTPQKVSDLEAAQAEINKSIPYKLPPETSVQLVPATPEETETTTSPPPIPTASTSTTSAAAVKRDKNKDTKTASVPQKRQRRAAAQKARDSIVISDEEEGSTEDEAPKKPRKRKSAPKIELNPNFISHLNFLNGSGGNEAEELMALLMKQKAAILKDNKVQRRRRNSVSNLITLPPSEFDALIDLDDDIVLMEPVTTTSSTEAASTTRNQGVQQQKIDFSNTFVIPSVPLITRPIIKRRKTVIHSPKNRFDLSIDLKDKYQTPISSSTVAQTKEKLMEETINEVATGNITSDENKKQQNTAKTTISEASLTATAELPPIKPPQQKKLQSKSALGQQLLEAIGLQQRSPKVVNSSQTEAASSSTLPNALTVLPNSKQSIQQIRSALKKSLKQAQEQQQQRKKELSASSNNTIIQDADSTTKPVIKEIVVVEGKGNKGDNCSSIVDVEDQIDKVTLMVRKDNSEKTTTNTTTSTDTTETNESKELKKSTSTKFQERRRTLLATGSKGIGARNTADKENPIVEDKQVEVEKSIEQSEENEKLDKQDAENAYISSSSAAVGNLSNRITAPNKAEIVTPKRRGRKRLVDKQIEQEAAAAYEGEKDDKSALTLTEISRTFDKSKDEDTETSISNIKNEEETESNKTSGRPARQSKTQSKYYKGPDKPIQGRRSLPSRTTRNRKYS